MIPFQKRKASEEMIALLFFGSIGTLIAKISFFFRKRSRSKRQKKRGTGSKDKVEDMESQVRQMPVFFEESVDEFKQYAAKLRSKTAHFKMPFNHCGH